MDSIKEKSIPMIRDATVVIKEILSEIGVFPGYTNGITLAALNLTEEQRHIRMEPMRGEMEAKRAINRAPAYFEPLVAMIKRCQEAGIDLNHSDAIRNFLTQKVIEVLPAMKGSVNLVGADMEKIIGMIPLAHGANGSSRSVS